MTKDETGLGTNNSICKNCGEPLEPGIKFCIKCGTPIDGTSETALEPELQSEADELLKQDELLAAQPLLEQEQIKPDLQEQVEAPPQEPVLAPPAQEPIYQAESYAPPADLPFPDAPETPAQTTSQRQSPKQTGIFVSGILGFVVMAVLLLGAFAAALFNYDFLATPVLSNVLLQILMYGSLAFATVMTSRAKGPDISVGAVMAFAAVLTVSISGSWILGVVLAVLVCAAIGAVNGLLIVYLRVPALITTILVSSLLRGILYTIGGGSPIPAGNDIKMLVDINANGLPIIPLAVFAFAFILAFLFVLLSKLGKPMAKREASDNKSVSYFTAYLFSSVIACLVGILMLSMYGAALPNIGLRSEIFILFIFAAITSTRFLDNKAVPVFYAIIATILFVVTSTITTLYNIDPFIQQIIMAVIAIGFVAVSYIARKDTFKDLVHRI